MTTNYKHKLKVYLSQHQKAKKKDLIEGSSLQSTLLKCLKYSKSLTTKLSLYRPHFFNTWFYLFTRHLIVMLKSTKQPRKRLTPSLQLHICTLHLRQLSRAPSAVKEQRGISRMKCCTIQFSRHWLVSLYESTSAGTTQLQSIQSLFEFLLKLNKYFSKMNAKQIH